MRLSNPIGKMAVVLNEIQETTEMVAVDTVKLVSHAINNLSGTAIFALVFGGVDSLGKFHIDLSRATEVATIPLLCEKTPTEFNALFRDAQGNAKNDYPKAFFDSLCEDVLFEIAFRQIWGGKYPIMEVTFESKKTYRFENGKKTLVSK